MKMFLLTQGTRVRPLEVAWIVAANSHEEILKTFGIEAPQGPDSSTTLLSSDVGDYTEIQLITSFGTFQDQAQSK